LHTICLDPAPAAVLAGHNRRKSVDIGRKSHVCIPSARRFGGSFTERGNAIFTGVLIGVGFEYALTDNWTTKFEYNYIDYGNKVVNFTETCPACGAPQVTTFSQSIKEIKQIAKIGVNYKFDYGSAVVAKY
jgi:outer membrane immunogenic protein